MVLVWICRLALKSSAEVLGIRYPLGSGSNPRLDTKILSRGFKLSGAAGHLKFRHQTRCSNLLMYIDNINFLLPSQFKDQIWWNLRPDIWSQKLRPRIWVLVYRSRLKPSAGYQDPRARVSDMRPEIWNSDIRQDAVISHGTSDIQTSRLDSFFNCLNRNNRWPFFRNLIQNPITYCYEYVTICENEI